MVDKSLVSSKISHVNECLERLRDKGDISKETFLKDKDIQDIILHNLQVAIQGCIDIASHVVSDQGWGVPATLRELFDILKEKKVIVEADAKVLKKMVGFRNLIIHEYEDIDLEKVYDIFKNRLSDFTKYLKSVLKFFKL